MNRPINDDGFKLLMERLAAHARKTTAKNIRRDQIQAQELRAEADELETEIERLMKEEKGEA